MSAIPSLDSQIQKLIDLNTQIEKICPKETDPAKIAKSILLQQAGNDLSVAKKSTSGWVWFLRFITLGIAYGVEKLAFSKRRTEETNVKRAIDQIQKTIESLGKITVGNAPKIEEINNKLDNIEQLIKVVNIIAKKIGKNPITFDKKIIQNIFNETLLTKSSVLTSPPSPLSKAIQQPLVDQQQKDATQEELVIPQTPDAQTLTSSLSTPSVQKLPAGEQLTGMNQPSSKIAATPVDLTQDIQAPFAASVTSTPPLPQTQKYSFACKFKQADSSYEPAFDHIDIEYPTSGTIKDLLDCIAKKTGIDKKNIILWSPRTSAMKEDAKLNQVSLSEIVVFFKQQRPTLVPLTPSTLTPISTPSKSAQKTTAELGHTSTLPADKVVESAPKPEDKLDLDQALQFYFSHPTDKTQIKQLAQKIAQDLIKLEQGLFAAVSKLYDNYNFKENTTLFNTLCQTIIDEWHENGKMPFQYNAVYDLFPQLAPDRYYEITEQLTSIPDNDQKKQRLEEERAILSSLLQKWASSKEDKIKINKRIECQFNEFSKKLANINNALNGDVDKGILDKINKPITPEAESIDLSSLDFEKQFRELATTEVSQTSQSSMPSSVVEQPQPTKSISVDESILAVINKPITPEAEGIDLSSLDFEKQFKELAPTKAAEKPEKQQLSFVEQKELWNSFLERVSEFASKQTTAIKQQQLNDWITTVKKELDDAEDEDDLRDLPAEYIRTNEISDKELTKLFFPVMQLSFERQKELWNSFLKGVAEFANKQTDHTKQQQLKEWITTVEKELENAEDEDDLRDLPEVYIRYNEISDSELNKQFFPVEKQKDETSVVIQPLEIRIEGSVVAGNNIPLQAPPAPEEPAPLVQTADSLSDKTVTSPSQAPTSAPTSTPIILTSSASVTMTPQNQQESEIPLAPEPPPAPEETTLSDQITGSVTANNDTPLQTQPAPQDVKKQVQSTPPLKMQSKPDAPSSNLVLSKQNDVAEKLAKRAEVMISEDEDVEASKEIAKQKQLLQEKIKQKTELENFKNQLVKSKQESLKNTINKYFSNDYNKKRANDYIEIIATEELTALYQLIDNCPSIISENVISKKQQEISDKIDKAFNIDKNALKKDSWSKSVSFRQARTLKLAAEIEKLTSPYSQYQSVQEIQIALKEEIKKIENIQSLKKGIMEKEHDYDSKKIAGLDSVFEELVKLKQKLQYKITDIEQFKNEYKAQRDKFHGEHNIITDLIENRLPRKYREEFTNQLKLIESSINSTKNTQPLQNDVESIKTNLAKIIVLKNNINEILKKSNTPPIPKSKSGSDERGDLLAAIRNPNKPLKKVSDPKNIALALSRGEDKIYKMLTDKNIKTVLGIIASDESMHLKPKGNTIQAVLTVVVQKLMDFDFSEDEIRMLASKIVSQKDDNDKQTDPIQLIDKHIKEAKSKHLGVLGALRQNIRLPENNKKADSGDEEWDE